MGHLHKRLLDSTTLNDAASTLYAFIDNCNHKSTSTLPGRENLNFNTYAKNGELIVSVYDYTAKGQEYAYTYSPNMASDKILYRYGFFMKNNPHAVAHIYINIFKTHFSRKKNDICKELRCFDQYFDDFYAQNNMEQATLQFAIARADIQNRILNAFRLYTYSNPIVDKNEIIRKLINGQWLNYESEIRAYSFFRDAIISMLKVSKLSYVCNY